MRLSSSESTGIISACEEFLKGKNAKLYLFGSRIDPALKGGDIDLLIEVETPDEALQLDVVAHRIIAAMKMTLGDQKIDLSIKSMIDIHQDPFWKLVLPKALLLKSWKKN